jgi:hypothetical protein
MNFEFDLKIELCSNITLHENQFEIKIQRGINKQKYYQNNFSQFQISKFYQKYINRIHDNMNKNLQFNRSFEY